VIVLGFHATSAVMRTPAWQLEFDGGVRGHSWPTGGGDSDPSSGGAWFGRFHVRNYEREFITKNGRSHLGSVFFAG